MIKKTVEIGTLGTRLSVSHRQLVIERPDTPRAVLPIEDIGVIIVDDQRATYTQAVFIELLDAGATVLITGKDHLPSGMMLPLNVHHAQTERHRAQIEASEPSRKQIWRALVAAKLRQQGTVLMAFTGDDTGLFEMSKRVGSGDPENLEARGAQRYWPALFGKEFRRDRSADGINAALNYGYAIIRAAIARSIVAAGLIPSLGVFHKNRSNPFCLADDLLEPYRPYVDWRVKLMSLEDGGQISLEDRSRRAALLSLFNETIMVGGHRSPLLLAVQTSATSLCRALTEKGKRLVLPEGLPMMADSQAPEDEEE